MARKRNATQKHKDWIRLRDRRKFHKRYVCILCGVVCETQLHHLKYSDVYDERAIMELCEGCHPLMDAIKKTKGVA